MPRCHILLIVLFARVLFASPVSAEYDSVPIVVHKDIRYFQKVTQHALSQREKVTFVREKKETTAPTLYRLYEDSLLIWKSQFSEGSRELDTILQRNRYMGLYSSATDTALRPSLSYQVTPWCTIPPLYKEDSLPRKLLDLFAWKSGGSAYFSRNMTYNTNGAQGDTVTYYVDLLSPRIYDYTLDLAYTHRILDFLWVGGGLSRVYEQSTAFDTLRIDRRAWFQRMGWELHIALPGFKYELFHDPRLIPQYGIYEDSLYTNLFKEASYEIINSLNIDDDTSTFLDTTIYRYPDGTEDTIVVEDTAHYVLRPLTGVGQKLTFKVGYFQYSLLIQPQVYQAPLHLFLFKGLPFFKGEWEVGMYLLPHTNIVPHVAIDFYRTSIDIGGYSLGISPFHLGFELWGQQQFRFSLGFNIEFLMGKATFSKGDI